MRALRLALPAALFALMSVAADSAAQSRVIVVSGSPAYPAAYSRSPVRRVVVRPRVIVVERIVVDRNGRGRDNGWWKRHGFRPVRVYYLNGRFYDRRFDQRGIREVVVYTRGGRYYRDRGDRYDRYDRYDRDGDSRDRYDSRYDSRYDDRYDERYDDRTDRERERDRRLKEREAEWNQNDDKYDRD